MRKQQTQQLLELVDTLQEAQQECQRFFKMRNCAAVVNLLGDSQEAVRKMTAFIAEVQGKETKTAALLKECYESFYQAGAGLLDNQAVKPPFAQIKQQLKKVKYSIQTELKPDRMEVLFLPYKAAMWDSLESVWLAAKSDPACDAVVVPIPYYDRNPDGSLGKMHYEGELYPADISIVDWQTYDVVNCHPDVIFIHNPYDDENLVTSVHPAFYSRRLRACTDMLVYIPYFVISGNVSEHFCTVAGCIYAHKTILQSKSVCDTYIRIFKEAFGNRFGNPKNKFIALGSPKFDKVTSVKRGMYTIVKELDKLLVGKKVILYNTSIGAMLKNCEQYLVKLRYVLSVFRGCEDVVLWWRPHPLLENTLDSMRPALANTYRKIVNEYKREAYGFFGDTLALYQEHKPQGKGSDENNKNKMKLKGTFIYDDSPDLHRAIEMSDAYFGDGSSIVELYKLTGKPILIQSISNDTSYLSEFAVAYRKWMSIYSLCQVGEHCYFASSIDNSLFKINLSDMIAEYVCSLPEETDESYGLYGNVIEQSGKLYFAPRSARNIVIYDIDKRITETIAVPDRAMGNWNHDERLCKANKFYEILAFKDKVFFIPLYYPGFIVFDTKTNEIKVIDEWVKSFAELEDLRFDDAVVSIRKVEISPALVAFVSQVTNVIFFLDLEKETVTFKKIGIKGDAFRACCYDGDCIWAVSLPSFINNDKNLMKYPVGFHIYKYSVMKDTVSEVPLSGTKIKLHGTLFDFECAVYNDGFVYLCPAANESFIKIDVKTNEFSIVHDFDVETRLSPSDGQLFHFSMAQVIDGKLYAFGIKSKNMYCCDFNSGKVETKPLKLSAKSVEFLFKKKSLENYVKTGVAYEPWVDLSTFLEKATPNITPDYDNEYSNCGKNIYAFCRDQILGLNKFVSLNE